MQKLITLQTSEKMQKNVYKDHYIIDNVLSNTVSDAVAKILIEAFDCAEDGDYSESLKLYDLVLKKEPHNIGALIDKGVTLQNMGRYKLAIRSYDKALSVSPDNIDALLNKGSVLHSDQKCAMALAYKGLSLGELGQLHDAIKHFKKALSIDKEYDLANISKNLAQDLLKSIKKQKSKTL